MLRLQGLPPILDHNTRVLILGSMPGTASLQAQQYYAHPRNAFWPILGAFCGFAPDLPYAERIARLTQHGIGVWDVLQACERAGSLDRDIVPGSEQPNDLAGLLATRPGLRALLCNGGLAFAQCKRNLRASLVVGRQPVAIVRLPSTSPAHAAQPLLAKQKLWHAALARQWQDSP